MNTIFSNAQAFFEGKRRILTCAGLLLLLLALLLLPIRMGEQGNSHIFVLRQVETIAQNYVAEQLPKLAAATAITYVVNGTIAVLEELHISVIVISAAPFKVLSGINDSIKSLGNALLLCTGLLVFSSTIIDMLSFFCLKVLIPIAIVLRILHEWNATFFAWAGTLSRSLGIGAILVWLFFPTTSLVTKYINAVYLDALVAEQMRTVDATTKKLDAVREATLNAEEAGRSGDTDKARTDGSKSPDTEPGLLSRAVKNIGAALNPLAMVDAMKAKIQVAIDLAGNIAKGLVRLVVIFIFTTVVIPVGVFFFFRLIFKQLRAPDGRA